MCRPCRCKVGFDMTNNLAYKPVLYRCHLLHFNDNKYRFQLIRAHGKRGKHKELLDMLVFEHDHGNIQDYNPIAVLLSNDHDGNATETFHRFDQKRYHVSVNGYFAE